MKRILSSLLVAALVVLMTAGSLIKAFKSGRPGSSADMPLCLSCVFLVCQYGFSAVGLFTVKDVPLSVGLHRPSTPEVMA